MIAVIGTCRRRADNDFRTKKVTDQTNIVAHSRQSGEISNLTLVNVAANRGD